MSWEPDILQGKRLSMHLDNKVQRAYTELDAILEAERKLQFRQTEKGQAQSRLWGNSPPIPHIRQAPQIDPNVLPASPRSKRYIFSPKSPKAMQRRREQAALAAATKATSILYEAPATLSPSKTITAQNDAGPAEPKKKTRRTKTTKTTKTTTAVAATTTTTTTTKRRGKRRRRRGKKYKIKKEPKGVRPELAGMIRMPPLKKPNATSPAGPAGPASPGEAGSEEYSASLYSEYELSESSESDDDSLVASSDDGDDDENDKDDNGGDAVNNDASEDRRKKKEVTRERRKKRQQAKDEKRKREEEQLRRAQMSESQRIVDELPLSFIMRPKVRGLDDDARQIRGDTLMTKKLKRNLAECGLSREGTDTQLKLRLAQFYLRQEIESYRTSRHGIGGRKRTNSEDAGVNKKTSLMRRMAQMGNAEMWRNLGNDSVKRYVETFTLIHHVDDENETTKQKRLGAAAESQAGIASKVANLAGFVKRHHGEYKTRRRPCALCRHIFPLQNMTTTVTLKAVWNKRKEFPKQVTMPPNLEGRWDKLYGEVHVCGFCAQYFEPKVRSMDQQREYEMEELRKRQELAHPSNHKPTSAHALETTGSGEQQNGDSVITSAEKWKQQKLAHEQGTREIREKRRKKLILRNRSVFKRRTGFGTSNSQRPKSLWGRAAATDDASESSGGVRERGGDYLPRRPASAAPGSPAASRAQRSMLRVSVPVPETAATGSLVDWANASAVQQRRSPRPQSAAPRTRRRPGPMSSFGSSTSRIIPYRGHNNLGENTRRYRALRIDPVQQAKEMQAAREMMLVTGGRNRIVRDSVQPQERPSSAIPRKIPQQRPASAGPGRRGIRGGPRALRVQGGGGGGSSGSSRRAPRRPQSAAAGWMRRKRRVPRPEWRSIS